MQLYAGSFFCSVFKLSCVSREPLTERNFTPTTGQDEYFLLHGNVLHVGVSAAPAVSVGSRPAGDDRLQIKPKLDEMWNLSDDPSGENCSVELQTRAKKNQTPSITRRTAR